MMMEANTVDKAQRILVHELIHPLTRDILSSFESFAKLFGARDIDIKFKQDISKLYNKAKKEYIGTDVNSIIPTDDIMKISKTNYSDNKTKVYYQTYSNPYTSNSLNPNNDTLVKVVCSNADISYMNLFKTLFN